MTSLVEKDLRLPPELTADFLKLVDVLRGPDSAVFGRVDLELSRIVRDPEFQMRTRLDDDLVEAYAERMRAGAVFPPVIVYHVEGEYLLTQGFYRCAAAERAGRATIAAEVRRGTRSDARIDAAGANKEWDTLPLPHNIKDLRKAVRMVLEVEPGWSDGRIAEYLGVTERLVGKVRAKSDLGGDA